MRTLRMGTGLVVLAMAGSCGGGGGGGGGPGAAAFVGDHRLIGFSGGFEGIAGYQAGAIWGTATADGVSSVTLTADGNFVGTISSLAATALAYSVTSDGVITISSGSRDFEGRVGEGGHVTVVGAVTAGDPVIHVYAKVPSAPLSTATLNGSYHLIGIGQILVGGDLLAYTGPITFDGAGVATFGSLTGNQVGGIFTLSAGSIASYAVGADGSMSLTAGAATFEGTVLQGGGLVLLGGGTVDGTSPVVWALVKAASAATSATFAGTYGVVSFEFDAVQGMVSVTGRVDASVASIVRTGTTNANGTIAPSPPWSASAWAVTSDGGLVLTDSGGDTLRGGVTEDGRYAILGGGTSSGSRPTFQILVRQ